MRVGILSAAPLPGSVKVARRPVKPESVGASPTLAATLRKAGRYKLAALVPKTRPVQTGVGALPTPSANIQPKNYYETRHSLPKPIALSQELSAHQKLSSQFNRTSCSSKAEHPPDKRENAERYRAGRPFPRVAETD